MSPSDARLSPYPVAAAALSALAIAVLLLPGAPGMGDSAELTMALALAGIAHPTGYPLYVMVGHLFVNAAHTLGASWVLAANLWSAVGAAVAAGAFARLVQHVAAACQEETSRSGRPPHSAAACAVAIAFPVAALMLHPVWILSATIAEVYSWSNACLLLAAAFLIGQLRQLSGAQASHDWMSALIWGLLCGLCGTRHATSVLFIVPMSVALVIARARARRSLAAWAMVVVAAALLPLASYGWIAWRAAHPAAYQWPVSPTFESFLLHVRGANYAGLLGHFAPGREEWSLIRSTLMPWIVPGLLLGSILTTRVTAGPTRWGLLALFAGAVLQLTFIFSYGVHDSGLYFLPVLMVSLLASTPLLLWLARRASIVAAIAAASAVLVVLATTSIPRALREREELTRLDLEFRGAMQSFPFDEGIVLWADDHFHRFLVLQLLEGQRRGITFENPDMLVWPPRREEFRRRFGFDPLEGLRFRSPADLERISDVIRARAQVPVSVIH
ncbi:MAG: DUF2723 domain-containing protein [Candidatus Eisenbacteria bacterium]|uniref:DUF2723 domain-containing protein n=1 Tax=Eiseniibacteriota bacterium TaxID=2212470 RepID=A0A849SBX4_UNCEI|nr:DUF2723 domain-containing protein [Candidatus Eisenbacteria bacterium]